MATEMNKETFLKTLQTTRAQWEALLKEIDEARMTRPGVEGAWSMKDIIAHVAWYEREMIGILQERALVGSSLWVLPNAERNAAIFDQNRDRSLQDVLTEARRVYAELLEALQPLAEEDLIDPSRYRDMPADWVPWKVFADNTYDHYAAHIPAIRAWLDDRE
ncbi:MAG TPA: DinB family protein [Ktedonobacterales bacterium]|nr:DinB family protein [Ktedonobacterales bacterium]